MWFGRFVTRRSRRVGVSGALVTCIALATASMSVARAVTVPAAPPPQAVTVPATAPTSAAALAPAAVPVPVATDASTAASPATALAAPVATGAVSAPAHPATSTAAGDHLYRPLPQKPLQWKCGEHKLYLRGFPSTWTALITAKVNELNTAIPRLTWKVMTGAPPAGTESVIEYRALGTTARGITQHTITPTLFKTVVVSINKSVVTSPTATASGITVMHELAHMAGLDHRDSDPDSATTRKPRAGTGPFTGKLSPGDRAAFLVEGCAL